MRVYLPLKHVDRSDSTNSGTIASPDRRGGHILLVERDEYARRSARRILNHLGHEVTEAPSCDEGLARLQEDPFQFDAVMLDFVRTRRNGGDDLDAIHELHPGLPIVFTGSAVDYEHLGSRLAPGSSTFLPKPFGFERLLAAMNRILR